MQCPRCKGPFQVFDTVHNDKENETYRARKCTRCGYSCHTVEYEVVVNQRFKDDWNNNHRLNFSKKGGESR